MLSSKIIIACAFAILPSYLYSSIMYSQSGSVGARRFGKILSGSASRMNGALMLVITRSPSGSASRSGKSLSGIVLSGANLNSSSLSSYNACTIQSGGIVVSIKNTNANKFNTNLLCRK